MCVCACVSHQLDELLVADVAVLVALNEGQQHVQLVGVQLQLMLLRQTGEVLHRNETSLLGVQLHTHTRI